MSASGSLTGGLARTGRPSIRAPTWNSMRTSGAGAALGTRPSASGRPCGSYHPEGRSGAEPQAPESLDEGELPGLDDRLQLGVDAELGAEAADVRSEEHT